MHLAHIALAVQLACTPLHMLSIAQLTHNVMIGFVWWMIVAAATLGISLISLSTNIHNFHRRSQVSLWLSCFFCAAGALLTVFNLAQGVAESYSTSDTVCLWLIGSIFCGLLMFTLFSDCASTRKALRLRPIVVDFQPWPQRQRMFRVAFTGIIWATGWCILWVLTVPISQLLLCPPAANLTTLGDSSDANLATVDNNLATVTLDDSSDANLAQLAKWDHSFVSIEHFVTTWSQVFVTLTLASLVLAGSSLIIPWYFRMSNAYRHCDVLISPVHYTTTWTRRVWPACTILATWIATVITAAIYLAQAGTVDAMTTNVQKISMPVMSITSIATLGILLVWALFVEAQLLLA